MLLACSPPAPDSDSVVIITETPAPTPRPTATPAPTPTPRPALDPAAIWIGGEGPSREIALIGPDGDVEVVSLPLNDGQQATDAAAALDGSALFYLVWQADGSQRGIASWRLDEPNARLIVEPPEGYRIVALQPSADASQLAYVQVAEGLPFTDAPWQLMIVPAGGGDTRVVSGRDQLGGRAARVPFAWPAHGPVLLAPAAPEPDSPGIYGANVETGASTLILPAEDTLVASPVLAPDGTRLAYLQYDPAEGTAGAEGVTIRDLREGVTTTLAAPDGTAVLGARWLPDGDALLVDSVSIAGEDGSTARQQWAIAPLDGSEWTFAEAAGPGHEQLFDYEVYGEGVVYTLLPDGAEWEVAVDRALSDGTPPETITLDPLVEAYGSPTILYIPSS